MFKRIIRKSYEIKVSNNNPKKISWDGTLKNDLSKLKKGVFSEDCIRINMMLFVVIWFHKNLYDFRRFHMSSLYLAWFLKIAFDSSRFHLSSSCYIKCHSFLNIFHMISQCSLTNINSSQDVFNDFKWFRMIRISRLHKI